MRNWYYIIGNEVGDAVTVSYKEKRVYLAIESTISYLIQPR